MAALKDVENGPVEVGLNLQLPLCQENKQGKGLPGIHSDLNVSEHQTLVTSESGPGDQFELLPIDD